MTKPYNNNSIIGNGNLLACIQKTGELCRLYWPHIDFPQHIDRFNIGIYMPGIENSTRWLEDYEWETKQRYVEDTNILETEILLKNIGYKIIQTDYCLITENCVIRNMKVQNISKIDKNIGFIIYSSAIQAVMNLASSLFDFDTDTLVHYRHGYYLGVSIDKLITGFQLGNNAYEMASRTVLGGFDEISMMADGAIMADIGEIKAKSELDVNIYITISDKLKNLKENIKRIKVRDEKDFYTETLKYWYTFLNKKKLPEIKNKEILDVYKRSKLVFGLMADKKSGGLLAAAEIDEEFTKCGRYAFCWGRDAAFITEAMDIVGLNAEVDRFYDWALESQNENGSWYQRYYMDGNLAPSWGLQIDETGTIVYGMLKHFETINEINFLKKVWSSVEKACAFMQNFMDKETGLPLPSYDLWEERVGEHAYSSSAVYSGFISASKIAEILGYNEKSDEYKRNAEELKKAISKNFWSEENNRFLRSIRVKMNPWGLDEGNDKVYLMVNEKRYYRDFSNQDDTIDISLLGLSLPFDVVPVSDKKFRATVDSIIKSLTDSKVGGIRRYENDSYVGGNPWILTTLWLAMYFIKCNDKKRALEYLEWAVKGRTHLDLLPEQVSKDDGKPLWVIPLTWSHAMFVLTVNMLEE